MNSNYSRPINLGNPQEYTINELAQMIKQLAGMWLSFDQLPQLQCFSYIVSLTILLHTSLQSLQYVQYILHLKWHYDVNSCCKNDVIFVHSFGSQSNTCCCCTLLCLHKSTGIFFSTWLFVHPSVRLLPVVNVMSWKRVDFATNWHKWCIGQEDKTISFVGPELKVRFGGQKMTSFSAPSVE